MKIRHGFISNSSSSSFIIAIRNINSEIENLPNWAKKVVNSLLNSLQVETITNKEELEKYIIDRHGFDETLEELLEDDFYAKDLYGVMLKAIESGYMIKDIEVDSNDEYRNEFFSSLPKKPAEIYLIRNES